VKILTAWFLFLTASSLLHAADDIVFADFEEADFAIEGDTAIQGLKIFPMSKIWNK